MNNLLQDAKDMADEIDRIQPGTSVAFLIRRLATELQLQRKHYEHAIGLGKGTSESSAGGTDDRATDVEPGACPMDAGDGEIQKGTGEGR